MTNHKLHTPMYFFLAKFALSEIVLSTVVIPKFLSILLFKKNTISFGSCFTQSFFYFLLGTAELILLSVMSYDRYVAICFPLHYMTIMTWKRCVLLAAGCWFGGFLSISVPTILKLNLLYCGPNRINHFFCDNIPLVALACADTRLIRLIDFFLFSLVVLGSLSVIIFTYTCIILTILRIPSTIGQNKTLSTCSSHFTTLSLVYISLVFIYVTPAQGSSLETNKGMSLLTNFITPVLNPFIMTLRNQQVKEVLYELIKKYAITE
ncbi:olfactory receptor 6M1-like [Bombina bombina]|uniref:olfactory receptor 6M1-like n=1 Tax=Bombina bombina TaxID=8345 RepID=UPI00235AF42A|nr:olfactory receptor 6M1-like [Bombina bombina]